MNITDFTLGMQVRLGKGKVIWRVGAITTPEEASMPYPAGITLWRDSGQHRFVSPSHLDEITVVA